MNDLPGRGFGAQLSSGRGPAAPSVAVFYAPARIFCHRPQPAHPFLRGRRPRDSISACSLPRFSQPVVPLEEASWQYAFRSSRWRSGRSSAWPAQPPSSARSPGRSLHRRRVSRWPASTSPSPVARSRRCRTPTVATRSPRPQAQIRGSNTVIGSSNPLYVVDGVIYSDASISTGLFSVTASGNPQSTRNDGEKQDDPVNRLTDLNPNDVASIEILRGAAASSIYGSKGVNGVVIITTNRGKAGKPRANIIQRVGFSELVRGPGTRVFDTTTAFAQFGDTALIRSYVVNGVLP